MQIKSLRIKSYRSWKTNDTPVCETARKRCHLQLFQYKLMVIVSL